MECLTPSVIHDPNEKINPENGLEIDYGFIMDNVQGVRNLMKVPNLGGFRLFPNPVYFKFEEANNVSLNATPLPCFIKNDNIDLIEKLKMFVCSFYDAPFCNKNNLINNSSF